MQCLNSNGAQNLIHMSSCLHLAPSVCPKYYLYNHGLLVTHAVPQKAMGQQKRLSVIRKSLWLKFGNIHICTFGPMGHISLATIPKGVVKVGICENLQFLDNVIIRKQNPKIWQALFLFCLVTHKLFNMFKGLLWRSNIPNRQCENAQL